MPSVSEKQRRYMAMDYSRAKSGRKTKTGMTRTQLRDYSRKPRSR